MTEKDYKQGYIDFIKGKISAEEWAGICEALLAESAEVMKNV